MTDLLTAPAAESSRSPLIDASAQRAAAVAALGYGRSFWPTPAESSCPASIGCKPTSLTGGLKNKQTSGRLNE
jgi:hypothetical protein